MKTITIEAAKKRASKIILSLEGKRQTRTFERAYKQLKDLVSQLNDINVYSCVDLDKDYSGEVTLRTSLCKSYAYRSDDRSSIYIA